MNKHLKSFLITLGATVVTITSYMFVELQTLDFATLLQGDNTRMLVLALVTVVMRSLIKYVTEETKIEDENPQ